MRPSIIRVLIFLLIEATLTIWYFYFAAYKLSDILRDPVMFLLYPILTFILVVLISFLSHFIFFRNKNFLSVFTRLLNISFVVFILIIGYYFYNQRNYNKTRGYNAENQVLIEMAYSNGYSFIGDAFEKLQSQFKSPRNVDLYSYVSKDTNIFSNGVSESCQIVYFVYRFHEDKNDNQYFSKVYVNGITQQLVFFNDLITDNKEYNYVKELKTEDGTVKGEKFYLKNDRPKPINFKGLNDSLTNSTNSFKKQNDSLYKIFERKLLYEKTAQSAKIWEPKAMLLQFLSDKIYKYIDTAIYNLRSGAALNDADSLSAKLDSYKADILNIDPQIYNNIKHSAGIITLYFDSVKMSNNHQLDLDFSTMPKDEIMSILNRTKNNIEIIENKTLIFCNNKVE